MFSSTILFVFLYFPEDKTEYIPAVISLIIFSLLAYCAMRFFMNHSKKEELKARELEKELTSSIPEENG